MPMEFIRLTCVRPREQQATALGRGRGRGRSVCLSVWHCRRELASGILGGLTQADLLLMK